MKKTVLLIALLLVTTTVFAATKDVSKTVHNMGSTGTGAHFAGTIDQVCIYCHTPHNAAQSALLWNNANIPLGSTFNLYSSQNLSRNQYGVSLPAGSPSLLCLSCHDGKSAINVLHSSKLGTDVADNVGYGAGVAVNINKPYDGGFFDPVNPANLGAASFTSAVGANDGNNLTNDHPIGFSYSQVATDQGASQLHANPPAAIRLFGATQRMECSTCHDPHVNYTATGDPTLRPFLVMSNSGSGLCLACHNK